MPINKETIISVFNEKLTLEQWLKTINKALDEAVLTGVEIAKKGNATLSFKFTFEDGTFLESNDIVLQQGESVNGAYIQNGHLYLTLTNGANLDAGNVKPVSSFSIDASQHLIVNYGDGTSQDLGAIFNGNVNINGNFTANSIIENMNGYSFTEIATEDLTKEFIYVGAVKNGNKVTLVLALNITKTASIASSKNIGYVVMPNEVMENLYPTMIGGSNVLVFDKVNAVATDSTIIPLTYKVTKNPTNVVFILSVDTIDNLPLNTKCYIRIEQTFLLSDNLAQ